MNHPHHIVAVASLIFNKKDEVLLVKTERRGWELPGGQVEQGEDLFAALQREILEESSVKVTTKKLAAIYSSINDPSKVIFDFVSEYKDGLVKPDNEIMEAGWFSKEDALKNITNEIVRYRVEWLLKNGDTIRYVSYLKNPLKVVLEVILNKIQ